MIDLHSHSTASDGSLSPTELVALANQHQVTRLALTDHDTLDGLAAAQTAAAQFDMSLINGVEISARFDALTVHVLGLGVNEHDPGLREGLHKSCSRRDERAEQIGAGLEKAGVHEALPRTRRIAGDGAIGRAHFARMLIADGYAKDFKQVFRRYMVRGKPGYAAPQWMTMAEAVTLIRRSGGVAVLAHPAAYALTTRKLNRLTAAFRECGGGGIEVVSGQSDPDQVRRLAGIAMAHDLSGSTGSDFHGPDKPFHQLGRLAALPPGVEPVWDHHPLW